MSLKKSGCRHCMCPEVEPAPFFFGEQLLVLTLRRPAACVHCGQRQYVLPFAIQRMIRTILRTPRSELTYRR